MLTFRKKAKGEIPHGQPYCPFCEAGKTVNNDVIDLY